MPKGCTLTESIGMKKFCSSLQGVKANLFFYTGLWRKYAGPEKLKTKITGRLCQV